MGSSLITAWGCIPSLLSLRPPPSILSHPLSPIAPNPGFPPRDSGSEDDPTPTATLRVPAFATASGPHAAEALRRKIHDDSLLRATQWPRLRRAHLPALPRAALRQASVGQ